MPLVKTLSNQRIGLLDARTYPLKKQIIFLTTFIGFSFLSGVVGYFVYIASPGAQETFIKLTSFGASIF
tara:strand:+ start:2429 stop:2635 length:207 start_codon:yes stop_codon:yes gene_type:complete